MDSRPVSTLSLNKNMKTDAPLVLLFEDDPTELPALELALKQAFPHGTEIVSMLSKPGNPKRKGTYEELLRKDFADEFQRAELILCDQDLSGSNIYPGLSANVVMSVAREEGIPFAMYGRGNRDDMVVRLRQRRPFLERRFVLELGNEWVPATFAASAAMVFDGCREIRKLLNETIPPRRIEASSPAVWMSKILKRDSIRTRLSLYGSGDQQYLESLAFTDLQKNRTKLVRVLATELSYWLWDSILRFPGIIVDSVAAASLLNLSPASWEKVPVQALFAIARYDGPFSSRDCFWWRDELLRIVDAGECPDGLSLAKKKGIKGVVRSACCEDSRKPAGCYCMLSRKPVSRANSYGNIPYFPSGADLARISRKEFQRVAPWAGFEAKS
jgi:hypothetical protein